jgi:hypothetical protein
MNCFTGKVNERASSAVYLVESESNHLFEPSRWKAIILVLETGSAGRKYESGCTRRAQKEGGLTSK